MAKKGGQSSKKSSTNNSNGSSNGNNDNETNEEAPSSLSPAEIHDLERGGCPRAAGSSTSGSTGRTAFPREWILEQMTITAAKRNGEIQENQGDKEQGEVGQVEKGQSEDGPRQRPSVRFDGHIKVRKGYPVIFDIGLITQTHPNSILRIRMAVIGSNFVATENSQDEDDEVRVVYVRENPIEGRQQQQPNESEDNPADPTEAAGVLEVDRVPDPSVEESVEGEGTMNGENEEIEERENSVEREGEETSDEEDSDSKKRDEVLFVTDGPPSKNTRAEKLKRQLSEEAKAEKEKNEQEKENMNKRPRLDPPLKPHGLVDKYKGQDVLEAELIWACRYSTEGNFYLVIFRGSPRMIHWMHQSQLYNAQDLIDDFEANSEDWDPDDNNNQNNEGTPPPLLDSIELDNLHRPNDTDTNSESDLVMPNLRKEIEVDIEEVINEEVATTPVPSDLGNLVFPAVPDSIQPPSDPIIVPDPDVAEVNLETSEIQNPADIVFAQEHFASYRVSGTRSIESEEYRASVPRSIESEEYRVSHPHSNEIDEYLETIDFGKLVLPEVPNSIQPPSDPIIVPDPNVADDNLETNEMQNHADIVFAQEHFASYRASGTRSIESEEYRASVPRSIESEEYRVSDPRSNEIDEYLETVDLGNLVLPEVPNSIQPPSDPIIVPDPNLADDNMETNEIPNHADIVFAQDHFASYRRVSRPRSIESDEHRASVPRSIESDEYRVSDPRSNENNDYLEAINLSNLVLPTVPNSIQPHSNPIIVPDPNVPEVNLDTSEIQNRADIVFRRRRDHFASYRRVSRPRSIENEEYRASVPRSIESEEYFEPMDIYNSSQDFETDDDADLTAAAGADDDITANTFWNNFQLNESRLSTRSQQISSDVEVVDYREHPPVVEISNFRRALRIIYYIGIGALAAVVQFICFFILFSALAIFYVLS